MGSGLQVGPLGDYNGIWYIYIYVYIYIDREREFAVFSIYDAWHMVVRFSLGFLGSLDSTDRVPTVLGD